MKEGQYWDGEWEKRISEGIEIDNEKTNFLIEKLGIELKNKSILDVGCGTGTFLLSCSKHTPKLNGCDISKKSIELAKKNNPKANLKTTSLTNIIYPKNSIDIITAFAVIQHLLTEEERKKAIIRLIDILKPNGKMIIFDQVMTPQRKFLSKVTRRKRDKHILLLNEKFYLDLFKQRDVRDIKVIIDKKISAYHYLRLLFSFFKIKINRKSKIVNACSYLLPNLLSNYRYFIITK